MDPDAITVLTDALDRLDSSFVRAEDALRVDITRALLNSDNRDAARTQIDRAHVLASKLGSKRQHRRLERLTTSLR